jgi:hypothetical protein
MYSKATALAIAIALVTSTAFPAAAQDGVFDMGALTSTLSIDHVTQSERARARAQRGPSLGRVVSSSLRQPARATAYSAASTAALRYAPSLERRRANYAQFVTKTRAVDPNGADKLQALLASTDVVASMGPSLAKFGLRTDNLADAYTVWWMNAWQAAHGDSTQYGKPTIQAVRAQAASAIASAPGFGTIDDSTKQELSEIFLIQGAILEASLSKWKDDPDMLRKLGVATRQGARKSDVDLDAMTLTERGFVPSGRTGEADPAPDAEPTALAAASTAPPATPAAASPPYILIAAAGGAGLGGVFLLGKMMGKKG